MKVSITIAGLSRLFGDDLGAVVDVARAADEAAIDQLVLPDHVAIGTRLDRYPFGKRFPYPPEEPWLEPLTTLAAIAGATRRVRLGTGVLIAPLRPAILLAKTAATLDVLSGGRLDLGLGTGWQPKEFDAVGVPFARRAARMDDTARACGVLWTSAPPVSFASETVSFESIWLEPRPVQRGGVPLWFGGGAHEATARRIAELGVGWIPVGVMAPDELAHGVDLIRVAFADAGRDPAHLGVRAGLAAVVDDSGRLDLERTLAPVPELEHVGVTVVSLGLGRFLQRREDIVPFLNEVAAAVH